MAAERYFTPATFRFLRELAANNERPWFLANADRYDKWLKEPALRFIEDLDPRLEKVSPRFVVGPRSLFRIYRDTRFSKDKSPYKSHAGIQFRHELAKDVHAPGFYLHLEPSHSFAGAGIWHPDSSSLTKIREAIVEDPASWKRAKNAKRFRETFELTGDSLKTRPRGFDPDHPLIEDLRRKDFIGIVRLTEKEITAAGFLARFVELCRAAVPLQRFLCGAVGVPF